MPARRCCRAAAGRRGQRRAVDAAEARGGVSAQSIEACLAHAGLPRTASTSLPLHRRSRQGDGPLVAWQQRTLLPVRRRKTLPGVLAGLTRAVKYRMTEWWPGLFVATASESCSDGSCRERVLRDHSVSSTITRRMRRMRRGRPEFPMRRRDDRRTWRRRVRHDRSFRDGQLERRGILARPPFARRLLRARDQPAQHAGARRRGQGDGARRLCVADSRRGESAAPDGARTRRVIETVRPGHALGLCWLMFIGITPTSSSRTWRSASSSTSAWRWLVTRCGSPAVAGRHRRGRRVEREGHASDPAVTRSGGRLRVSAHGRRRTRARRRCGGGGRGGEKTFDSISAASISGRITDDADRARDSRRWTHANDRALICRPRSRICWTRGAS